MRRAKIVCTIGPASDSEERLEQLIDAGMNVARLNFSHGTHDDHRAVYNRVRALSERMGKPVAILQDLQGPKIRVGQFPGGGVDLKEGDSFTFVAGECEGTSERASISYDKLAQDTAPGEQILVDDGLLQLEIIDVRPGEVECVVKIGGRLKDRKGVNLPSTRISQPSLTPKDRTDLEFGIELGVDYVALSFVRSGLDIHQLRSYMPKGPDAPGIVAKIEKPQAVTNLHEIIAASDGVMIARGDLGVELPPEQVPIIQKRAIDMATTMGKLSITATQMLDSMTNNPRPTRAEASDVANAIFDGTDAVMLSGETASGRYPLEAVQIMDRIVCEAEASPFAPKGHDVEPGGRMMLFPNAIAQAATIAADRLGVKAIAAFTESGRTARLLRSMRPTKSILAFTPHLSVFHKMALYWGVTPVICEIAQHTDALVSSVEDALRTHELARDGEHVIIVLGTPVGTGAPTNTIKFHSLGGIAGDRRLSGSWPT